MNLAQLRELRPKWALEATRDGVRCQYGAWRFTAADPDDAEDEIERRVGQPDTPRPPRTPQEPSSRDTALSGTPAPGTFGAFMGQLNEPQI